jgi:antirestriction protein ArdC
MATEFHEMSHATGSAKRLNRQSIAEAAPFGSPAYSFENIIAEMLAAYLCVEAGISPAVIANQADYVQDLAGEATGRQALGGGRRSTGSTGCGLYN